LVTTSVPGHHRPLITKQLKCQSLHCGAPSRRSNRPRRSRCGIEFGCGKGARTAGAANLRTRLIPQQAKACFAVPMKAAPFEGNIRQQSGALPQP